MSDWDLIGDDPAPGNPLIIRSLAKEIGHTATAAHEARLALDGVRSDAASGWWRGDLADHFDQAFGLVPGDLGLMADSYETVSSALARYAERLEQIQQSVAHALNRARLATQREDLAVERRAAAGRGVADFTRQIRIVIAEERLKAAQASVTSLMDPTASVQAEHELAQLQATKAVITQALRGAEADQAVAQREIAEAASELQAARVWASNLRAEREIAERETAGLIEGALEIGLRNKSNIDLITGWVQNLPGELRSFGTWIEHLGQHETGRAADKDAGYKPGHDIARMTTVTSGGEPPGVTAALKDEATAELRQRLRAAGVPNDIVEALMSGDISKVGADAVAKFRDAVNRLANNLALYTSTGSGRGGSDGKATLSPAEMTVILGSLEIGIGQVGASLAAYLGKGGAPIVNQLSVLEKAGHATHALPFEIKAGQDAVGDAFETHDAVTIRAAILQAMKAVGTALQAVPIPEVQAYGSNWINCASETERAAIDFANMRDGPVTAERVADLVVAEGTAMISGVGMVDLVAAGATAAFSDAVDAIRSSVVSGDLASIPGLLQNLLKQASSINSTVP